MREIVIQTTDPWLARAMAREWNIPGVTFRPRISNTRTRAFGEVEILTIIAVVATTEAVKALLDLIEHHMDGKREQDARVDGEAVPQDPDERRRFAQRLLQEQDGKRLHAPSTHEQRDRKTPGAANDND